jgi:hypothetical protein
MSSKGFYIEAPFLSFHKHYETDQISGCSVTQENKQRLLGFRPMPSKDHKKEDKITIFILDPLPTRIWITSLATRLYSNKIVFRQKPRRNLLMPPKNWA